jgi:murein endopeptidase
VLTGTLALLTLCALALVWVLPQRSSQAAASSSRLQAAMVAQAAIGRASDFGQHALHLHHLRETSQALQRTARGHALQVGITATSLVAEGNWVNSVRWPLGEDGSLDRLAGLFSTTVEDLARLNPTVDLARVQPGDSLVVFRRDRAVLSASRGAPNQGRLVDGVPMPQGDAWIVRNPRYGWGTPSTIRALREGFLHVHQELPGGSLPVVADISRRAGGRLTPHRSHQSGRDADVTFFHRAAGAGEPAPWVRHTAQTLDLPRQWALFRHWIQRDMVDDIFVDSRLIRALERYAASIGEDPDLMQRAFGTRHRNGILSHQRGHSDHLHVRFRCHAEDVGCRGVGGGPVGRPVPVGLPVGAQARGEGIWLVVED